MTWHHAFIRRHSAFTRQNTRAIAISFSLPRHGGRRRSKMNREVYTTSLCLYHSPESDFHHFSFFNRFHSVRNCHADSIFSILPKRAVETSLAVFGCEPVVEKIEKIEFTVPHLSRTNVLSPC